MKLLDQERVRNYARDIGFDVVRFARAEVAERTKRDLIEFIGNGLHGDMAWMEDNIERRADPSILWPGVKTAIIVGLNYCPSGDPLKTLERRERGSISVYARNRDYHDILKKRLKRLAAWMADKTGAEVKVFVDTAPVLEKPLAQQAGLGWQGKHTNLVSRTFGSWLFLGEVFTTLEFDPDEPETDHCGGCRSCLDVCPTNAFVAPYKLDARRCISYLTIEHKGPIPRDLRPLMGNRIYGCDDCLAVCPWNKFASATREDGFLPRTDLSMPLLKDLVSLEDKEFRVLFSGSPIKRIGRGRFVSNVLIAIGNSGDQSFIPSVESLLRDDLPLVRGAAVWALRQLMSIEQIKTLMAAYLPLETDPEVQKEWV